MPIMRNVLCERTKYLLLQNNNKMTKLNNEKKKNTEMLRNISRQPTKNEGHEIRRNNDVNVIICQKCTLATASVCHEY